MSVLQGLANFLVSILPLMIFIFIIGLFVIYTDKKFYVSIASLIIIVLTIVLMIFIL